MRKSIKINATLNMIRTICNIAFPLITFPYVSRVLKPENIGKVNFGNSFVSYFSLIASLGISTYAIRECSLVKDDRTKLSKSASQIFSINVCTTIVAYVAMFITLGLFRKFDAYRTLIIIQSTTILFTTLGCDWINQAMEDFRYITYRSIIFQIISLILLFSFVKEPSDYIKYAAISVISSTGANITNIFYIKKYCNVKFVLNIDWKKHLPPIALLFVMLLAQNIFNNSDITMLGLMKNDIEVGLYSTAVKIENVLAQIVSSIVWVIMPRLSIYFENKDYKEINSLLSKAFNILITLGFPLTVGTICLSKEIILIIAGKEYVNSAITLNILMLSFLFSLVGGSFLGNMVLLPSKRESTYMKICCIATATNLILNYFLIPKWGANAAAGTTAFASLLMTILLVITKDKNIKISNYKSSIIPAILGCLIIFIECNLFKMLVSNYILVCILSILSCVISYIFIEYKFNNMLVIDTINSILNKLKTNKKI